MKLNSLRLFCRRTSFNSELCIGGLGAPCSKGVLCQNRMSPRNPEQKIIKRVIALEGDIIKTIGYKKKYVKVPHGHIWVEGDHHGHSFDSNAFGPVSLGLLHARATHILWPPQRWQKLQPMLPPERKPLQREQE
uniref:Mitochondrial inner membrane protease subunit 2 n=1 Tax=Dromaius novaehollandiae TaxID=8790 RepID=A0A8C4J390_DRONO